jgi:hypothetical protein
MYVRNITRRLREARFDLGFLSAILPSVGMHPFCWPGIVLEVIWCRPNAYRSSCFLRPPHGVRLILPQSDCNRPIRQTAAAMQPTVRTSAETALQSNRAEPRYVGLYVPCR